MGRATSKLTAAAAAAIRLVTKTCLVALAGIAFDVPLTHAGAPLVPIGSIPLKGVEGRLDHLSCDARSQRLFVSALENHTVEIIDLARHRRVHEITGVSEPQGVVYLPRQNRLLVCCRGDGTCRGFDATTFREGSWVDLGRNADNVRFDPETQLVFVGSGGEPGTGLLSAIKMTSLLPVEQGGRPAPPRSPADFLVNGPRQADAAMEISLPAHPESFQLDPANHRVFVNVPDAHEIAVLQVVTNGLTQVATWPVTVGDNNFAMTLDVATDRMFIAVRQPSRLAVYNLRTGALLGQCPCVGDVDDMFYAAPVKRLYLIGGDGFVEVFQIPGNSGEPKRLARLPTAPRARTGLFIPELNMLAVAAPHTSGGPAAVLLYRTQP